VSKIIKQFKNEIDLKAKEHFGEDSNSYKMYEFIKSSFPESMKTLRGDFNINHSGKEENLVLYAPNKEVHILMYLLAMMVGDSRDKIEGMSLAQDLDGLISKMLTLINKERHNKKDLENFNSYLTLLLNLLSNFKLNIVDIFTGETLISKQYDLLKVGIEEVTIDEENNIEVLTNTEKISALLYALLGGELNNVILNTGNIKSIQSILDYLLDITIGTTELYKKENDTYNKITDEVERKSSYRPQVIENSQNKIVTSLLLPKNIYIKSSENTYEPLYRADINLGYEDFDGLGTWYDRDSNYYNLTETLGGYPVLTRVLEGDTPLIREIKHILTSVNKHLIFHKPVGQDFTLLVEREEVTRPDLQQEITFTGDTAVVKYQNTDIQEYLTVPDSEVENIEHLENKLWEPYNSTTGVQTHKDYFAVFRYYKEDLDVIRYAGHFKITETGATISHITYDNFSTPTIFDDTYYSSTSTFSYSHVSDIDVEKIEIIINNQIYEVDTDISIKDTSNQEVYNLRFSHDNTHKKIVVETTLSKEVDYNTYNVYVGFKFHYDNGANVTLHRSIDPLQDDFTKRRLPMPTVENNEVSKTYTYMGEKKTTTIDGEEYEYIDPVLSNGRVQPISEVKIENQRVEGAHTSISTRVPKDTTYTENVQRNLEDSVETTTVTLISRRTDSVNRYIYFKQVKAPFIDSYELAEAVSIQRNFADVKFGISSYGFTTVGDNKVRQIIPKLHYKNTDGKDIRMFIETGNADFTTTRLTDDGTVIDSQANKYTYLSDTGVYKYTLDIDNVFNTKLTFPNTTYTLIKNTSGLLTTYVKVPVNSSDVVSSMTNLATYNQFVEGSNNTLKGYLEDQDIYKLFDIKLTQLENKFTVKRNAVLGELSGLTMDITMPSKVSKGSYSWTGNATLRRVGHTTISTTHTLPKSILENAASESTIEILPQVEQVSTTGVERENFYVITAANINKVITTLNVNKVVNGHSKSFTLSKHKDVSVAGSGTIIYGIKIGQPQQDAPTTTVESSIGAPQFMFSLPTAPSWSQEFTLYAISMRNKVRLNKALEVGESEPVIATSRLSVVSGQPEYNKNISLYTVNAVSNTGTALPSEVYNNIKWNNSSTNRVPIPYTDLSPRQGDTTRVIVDIKPKYKVGIYDDTTANIINEKEVNIVGSRTCNFYRLYSIGDLLNGLKNSTSVTRAGITSSDYNQLWVKITSTPQTIYRLFPAIGTDNATCTIHEPVKSITVSGIPLSNFTLHSPKEDGYTYTKQTGYVNGSVDLFIKGTYLPTNMNKHVSTTNIENISIPLSYTITYKFSDNTPSESVTLSGVKLWVNTKVKVGVGLRKKYIGYIYNEDSYDLPSLEFKRLAQRLPSENTPLNAGLLYEEQGGALQYYQPYMTELVNYGLSAGAPDTPYVFDSMPSRDEILSFPRGELIYVRDNNPIYYRTYKVTDTLVDLNKLI
jgi:hypothetical protein